MPFAKVGDIDVYYEVHGEGEPLLLIGGLGSNLRFFKGIIEALALHHRVVAFDNRGAGRTDKPDVPYSIKMMAADTAGLMDSLGLKEANVLGVSMGGRIALEIAISHPERIRRLILVSTFPGKHTKFGMSWPFYLLGLLKLLPPMSHWQPRYAYERQRHAVAIYDASDELGEIHAPTLILHGRRDWVAFYAEAQEMNRGIRGSKLETFNGGHTFFMTRERQRFLECVTTFLDEP